LLSTLRAGHGRQVTCVAVRCPSCLLDDDKVVDSRSADEGTSIRRRRHCLACGHRFTTYERVEEVPLIVLKRSGQRQPFDRQRLVAGLQAAAKGRPLAVHALEHLCIEIEESFREAGRSEVPSEAIGRAVLERLLSLDEVAYLRFASVYKDFGGAADFGRELQLLKSTAPKHH
jgi:transcriptional repressor NrdR